MFENKADRDFQLWAFLVIGVIVCVADLTMVRLEVDVVIEWVLVFILVFCIIMALRSALSLAMTLEGQHHPKNAMKIGPFRIWRQTFS